MSLAGLTVTFVSFTANGHPDFANKSMAQLRNAINACGGSYTPRVDQSTHLVATPAQYEKQLNRVKEGLNCPSLLIVNYDWLADSLTSHSPVDAEDYLLHGSAANAIGAIDLGSDEDQPISKAGNNPSKRSREDDENGEEDTVQSKKAKTASGAAKATLTDVAVAQESKIHVPVDAQCSNAADYHVHVDDHRVVYDATLNKSDSHANNNKFYKLQLLVKASGEYFCWTHWGRVGDQGQSKLVGDGTLISATREFERKFREKNGNMWQNRDGPQKPGKYAYIEINYEKTDDDMSNGENESQSQLSTPGKGYLNKGPTVIPSKLHPGVQRLMELIFNLQLFNNTMASLNYDANKMPLGKLSKKTLLKGYEVLKDLASLIADADLARTTGSTYGQAISERSNHYFSLVPHAVGRRSLPILQDMDAIKNEIQLLETLTDMQLANEIMTSAKVATYKQQERLHILDRQYQALGMQEMTTLQNGSTEFDEIQTYLLKSVGSTHGIDYVVHDIFRVERDGEADRLNKSTFANLGGESNRRLLWHGSRCSNFGGILSKGLRIAPPEAPSSGYMFGKGIYLADMSSKSANYCASYNSGGTGLLLLCEAELGTQLKLTNADYGADDRAKREGCNSTWGLGQTGPLAWKDASCVNKDLKGVLMPNVKAMPPGSTGEKDACLLYNEYIVYDVAQIKLRYLVRATMT